MNEDHFLPWHGSWPEDPDVREVLERLRRTLEENRIEAPHYLVVERLHRFTFPEVKAYMVGQIQLAKCAVFGKNRILPQWRDTAAFAFSDKIYRREFLTRMENTISDHLIFWECSEGEEGDCAPGS